MKSLPTITDLRFLDVHAPVDRYQIEVSLREMGTEPEVIDWFFCQFDSLKVDYTKQLRLALDSDNEAL